MDLENPSLIIWTKTAKRWVKQIELMLSDKQSKHLDNNKLYLNFHASLT